VTEFRDQMREAQLKWRRAHLPGVQGRGRWNGSTYEHILPRRARASNLWPGLLPGGTRGLDDYLRRHEIQPHTGRDNLLSSWTLCANLYFPFGAADDGKRLLGSFLADRTGLEIASVDDVELEFAEEPGSGRDAATLLGEQGGKRGANQTSPDVAFPVRLISGGRALVLTEVKFTEHSFYSCSGYRLLEPKDRDACRDSGAVLADPDTRCAHAALRGRKYWEHLAAPADSAGKVKGLRWCPAATAGYQLFRQQALAEALASDGEYEVVVSSVACDGRNRGLMRSLRRTGVRDIASDWGALFDGRARFCVFTHQDWVAWVDAAPAAPAWTGGWVSWVRQRYGL